MVAKIAACRENAGKKPTPLSVESRKNHEFDDDENYDDEVNDEVNDNRAQNLSQYVGEPTRKDGDHGGQGEHCH